MPLIDSIEAVKEDITGVLKIGSEQVALSQKELLLFGLLRLILGSAGGSDAGTIDNEALADAIANALELKTLTVIGDTVGAATQAALAGLLTELTKKTNTTDISSVNLNKYGSNSTVSFNANTISGSFTLADKYLIAIIPAISDTPNITLQVSLDGTNYTDTSVSITASASRSVIIESDLFNRVIACIGLANALRFKSSTSINATISLRNSHG